GRWWIEVAGEMPVEISLDLFRLGFGTIVTLPHDSLGHGAVGGVVCLLDPGNLIRRKPLLRLGCQEVRLQSCRIKVVTTFCSTSRSGTDLYRPRIRVVLYHRIGLRCGLRA